MGLCSEYDRWDMTFWILNLLQKILMLYLKVHFTDTKKLSKNILPYKLIQEKGCETFYDEGLFERIPEIDIDEDEIPF